MDEQAEIMEATALDLQSRSRHIEGQLKRLLGQGAQEIPCGRFNGAPRRDAAAFFSFPLNPGCPDKRGELKMLQREAQI